MMTGVLKNFKPITWINQVTKILNPISFGFLLHELKQNESCHRIKSPALTLLAHLFSFVVSTIFSYYYGGELLSTVVDYCYVIVNGPHVHQHTCSHTLPKLSLIGGVLLLLRGALSLLSKSIWFESECKTHHHGSNNFAEKYVQESMIGAVVLLFFLLDALSKPINLLHNGDLALRIIPRLSFSDGHSCFTVLITASMLMLIVYTYVQIWQGRMLKKTQNYRKIFLSNCVQTFLLFCIVIEHNLSKTTPAGISYQYLGLALTLNVTLKELVELAGCFYMTYLSFYSIKSPEDTSIDVTVSIYTQLVEFVRVTSAIVIAHLAEHVGSMFYMHNATKAGLATLAEAYRTFRTCAQVTVAHTTSCTHKTLADSD